ncbi:helix-turn-helix domain-containing protein [Streptomyces thermoviolaceus]|uniref:helix-turn-helix domain-containing protein n=2 Tax=Streptomyces TaxID=1883 RepID=UPI001676BB2E|nr:helix-turn-helix transcriptional regulator [Streptomyces thermoviolaceus]WTD46061.1 helix-turn-helix transcriptional regulator [Streptomyces thermoviolaceus]GGV80699.1 hypothetical protein GCM10010499_43930 [Streptomyces thermoviolaceus subsp. apingens]GHA74206.1 hypothetical protein GCM10010512_00400 [Streptomyces thermoviolaceus subsp. thermoviolaceus]
MVPPRTAGDELICELARDIQDGARDLARLLPSLDGEEPLHRITQLQEQLDGLTAAAVGRARFRRVTWAVVSSALGISEDTARHRYTDRTILRRLARFNRSETPLTSLAGLFSATAPTRRTDTAGDAGSSGDPGTAGGERSTGADTQLCGQHERTPAAYNRLAPILSMLIRTAQLTNKEVSRRIGCSASYLSRILSGERVPTWELTRKFAHACGADPDVLRTVWESEKLRCRTPGPHPDPDPDPGAPPLPAAERLRAAIHTLHVRAGRPAPSDIAVASRWLFTAGTVASLLECTILPPRDLLQNLVLLLGGDVDHFTQLLDDARREAARSNPLIREPAPPRHPPTPRLPSTLPPARPHQTHGPDTVMKTFSRILTEGSAVEDGRARLLHKRAEEGTHPDNDRRPAALTGALRQRRRLPASITPLGTH